MSLIIMFGTIIKKALQFFFPDATHPYNNSGSNYVPTCTHSLGGSRVGGEPGVAAAGYTP